MCILHKYQLTRFIQTWDPGEETQWINMMIRTLIKYKEHLVKAGIWATKKKEHPCITYRKIVNYFFNHFSTTALLKSLYFEWKH